MEGLSTAQELESAIGLTLVRNATVLMSDGTLIEECVRLPALMWEILPKLVAQHESKEGIMELISDLASLTLGLERTKAEAAEAEAWKTPSCQKGGGRYATKGE